MPVVVGRGSRRLALATMRGSTSGNPGLHPLGAGPGRDVTLLLLDEPPAHFYRGLDGHAPTESG